VTAAGRPAEAEVYLHYGVEAESGRASPLPPGGPFPEERRARSDAEGRFRITGLPSGRGVLSVEPGGDTFSPGAAREVTLEDPSEVVVDLEPTTTMRLDVRLPDGETAPSGDAPAASAQVWSRDFRTGSYADTETLGVESGVVRLRLRGLRRGDPLDVLVRVGATWCLQRGLVPREEPYACDLQAPPHVRGRVLDAEDRPVRDAEVNVYMPQDAESPAYVAQGAYLRTDAEGRFDARPAFAGRYTVVARDALRDLRSPRVVVETDGSPVELRILPIVRVRGRVVGEEGPPLDRIVVRAVGPGADPSQASSGTCTADGWFEVDWPGTKNAWLEASAYAGSVDDLCAVLEASVDDEEIRLVLRPTSAVTGSVRDSRGPVAGVRVFLRGLWTWREALTDAQGRFALRAVAEPSLEATAAAPDGRRVRRKVTPGEVDLVLP
jgi:hypothetical protein